jgi:hypothetical protein
MALPGGALCETCTQLLTCWPSTYEATLPRAREHLNRRIQVGAESSGEKGMGKEGHSSVEDSRAALDLVRWYLCEKRKRAELL